MPEYNRDNSSTLSAKQIPGLTSVGINYSSTETGPSLSSTAGSYTWEHIYYDRNRFTLSYNMQGHGIPVASVSNIMYGQQLFYRNVSVADTGGYEFKGWYKDTYGQALFDFNSTMPAANQSIFAKWESNALHVTFLDTDGSALGSNNTQGLDIGDVLNLNGITIDGVAYVGGGNVLFVDGKGWFEGWDYYPSGSGSSIKIKFPVDMQIWQNTDLYARWKTDGFRITYLGEGAPIDTNSYRLGADTRILGQGNIADPTDETIFIGWRDTAGKIYYENSLVTIQ